jgi:hypothetical protein
MSPDEAIEYALSKEGVGGPSLPKEETAGLSGRELEVLRLVAEGLTRPPGCRKALHKPAHRRLPPALGLQEAGGTLQGCGRQGGGQALPDLGLPI